MGKEIRNWVIRDWEDQTGGCAPAHHPPPGIYFLLSLHKPVGNRLFSLSPQGFCKLNPRSSRSALERPSSTLPRPIQPNTGGPAAEGASLCAKRLQCNATRNDAQQRILLTEQGFQPRL